MNEIHCRFCGRYLCSVATKDGKLRIKCPSCKRAQSIDLAERKVTAASHLQVAGMT